MHPLRRVKQLKSFCSAEPITVRRFFPDFLLICWWEIALFCFFGWNKLCTWIKKYVPAGDLRSSDRQ